LSDTIKIIHQWGDKFLYLNRNRREWFNTPYTLTGKEKNREKFCEGAIVYELAPIQTKVTELLKDKTYLENIYKQGAEKASYVANKTLRKMQKKIGFIPK
jgi:tryptophanyl-tRNA synthetase